MVSENMIIKHLISCQYFNEYSLNKNVEDEILTLIKKIRDKLIVGLKKS